MADFKEYREAVKGIVSQLGCCRLCDKPINPETDSFTLLHQKIQGQPTALAVLCEDCCLMRLAKPQNQDISNKEENKEV